MADIFISYKKEETNIAIAFANKFETEGWSVWWDIKIAPGEKFDETIQKELHKAKVVVVLWSKNSIKSDYVKGEAREAKDNNKLISVFLGETTARDLPFDIRSVQALHVKNEKNKKNLDLLVNVITERIGTPKPDNSEASSAPLLYRHRLKLFTGVLFSLAVFLFLIFTNQPSSYESSTLANVQSRGYLRCGINNIFPPFSSSIETSSTYAVSELDSENHKDAMGFEADFCRVVAIGIFGSHENKVVFKTLNNQTRFLALRNSDVDVVISNTTWTSRRDTDGIFSFGAVYYHDGQKFLARENLREIHDLNDKRVCVNKHTSSEANLYKTLEKAGIHFTAITESDGVGFHRYSDMLTAFSRNECDAITTDEIVLLALMKAFPVGGLRIFPDKPLSQEQFAPMVLKSDNKWRDIVNYAIWTTIWADERNITQQTVDDMFAVKTWENLGLPIENPKKIIKLMGNYGEIYDRHLGAILPQRNRNQPRILNSSGWLYSPPLN